MIWQIKIALYNISTREYVMCAKCYNNVVNGMMLQTKNYDHSVCNYDGKDSLLLAAYTRFLKICS